jgi:hypothetical protein
VLCDRFKHEFQQQAEKVAESAKESSGTGIGLGGGSGNGNGASAKHNEPAARKARTTTQSVQDVEVSKLPTL